MRGTTRRRFGAGPGPRIRALRIRTLRIWALRIWALATVLPWLHAQKPVGASPRDPTAALALADGSARDVGLARYRFVETSFGDIPVELSMFAASAEQAAEAAGAAFARVRELAAAMDDYALDPPSVLNRIAADAPRPVHAPVELLEVLQRSKELQPITAGAFDVTAKPFVHLWRVSRRLGALPPAERLRTAARFVDITALTVDRDAGTVCLSRPGMWLDLGGIAKGAIGDEVVRLLRSRGLPICSYHAGGDMVFGDAPPGLPGWPVRVPDLIVPADDPPEPLAFWASSAAASVSGDLFRYVEIDGVRYSHVIDPRTGTGVTTRRIACVHGPRGIDTDPLATAGLILDEAHWQRAVGSVPGCRGWTSVVGGSTAAPHAPGR